MYAQTQLPVRLVCRHLSLAHTGHEVADLKRRQHAIDRMCVVRFRDAADSHIGIADGLDLFKLMLPGDLIEMTKAAIQLFNQLLRAEVFGNACETDEIRKQD